MTEEYTPTTEPGYVAALKHAAGSYNSSMGPKGIARAIELIEAAAEQRGAEQTIERAKRALKKDHIIPDDTVSIASIIAWLDQLAPNRADQMEGNE